GRGHPPFSMLLGGVMRAIAMSLNPVAIFILWPGSFVALGSDDAVLCRNKAPRRCSYQSGPRA
ncbi:MAG: hypothetical protein ABJ015_27405, partial [Rhodopirellula bahusiensis]